MLTCQRPAKIIIKSTWHVALVHATHIRQKKTTTRAANVSMRQDKYRIPVSHCRRILITEGTYVTRPSTRRLSRTLSPNVPRCVWVKDVQSKIVFVDELRRTTDNVPVVTRRCVFLCDSKVNRSPPHRCLALHEEAPPWIRLLLTTNAMCGRRFFPVSIAVTKPEPGQCNAVSDLAPG